MKRKFSLISASLLAVGFASANEGLFSVGSEAQESIPLKWVVGLDLTYDSNVNPGAVNEDGATSVTPRVGMSFVSMTPQTTWDVYARLGLLCYFDAPTGLDDTYAETRVGVNLTHRFDERLRLSSRNFMSYEMEPDYAQGFATSRQAGEYFYWQTDNALGYRWTQRLASYTGFNLTGLTYDDNVPNSDRFTWSAYNQFRFQLTPQRTVLTLDYRYSDTNADGLASDSTDQYLTLGIEQRFSPTTIMVARAGAQFRDVDQGDSYTNPFFEMALNSRLTEQFTAKGFVRYSTEVYDTVQNIGLGSYDFDQRDTWRIGIAGDYAISPTFSVFGGLDYIPASFDDGRLVSPAGPPATASGFSEDLLNAYIGVSMKFNDAFSGSLTYNYTDSTSDFANRDYTRNRIALGLNYSF